MEEEESANHHKKWAYIRNYVNAVCRSICLMRSVDNRCRLLMIICRYCCNLEAANYRQRGDARTETQKEIEEESSNTQISGTDRPSPFRPSSL